MIAFCDLIPLTLKGYKKNLIKREMCIRDRFYDISLSSDSHINPFDLPVPGADDRPDDILRSNLINLVGLLRIMMSGLSAEEDAIIDQAIRCV